MAPTAVVLTAIPVECEAVLAHLLDVREDVHRAGTIFYRGRLLDGPWQVVLAQTGQGNARAAALAERVISHYQPELAVLVGVAGRLHTDLALGDVVVARKVYAIHGGKEDDAEFRPRPESWWPDHGHVQRAERVARRGTWREALLDQSGARAEVVVRPIASGEVVLDSVDSPYARLISRHYGDAAAIEMEGAGVALVGQLNRSLPVVVLRGISDYADGQKEASDQGGWQRRAARNAAAFAVALLAELRPARWDAAAHDSARGVAEDLLHGTTEQRLAAVRVLAGSRHVKAVPLLAKGFDATLDPDVSCLIIWALGERGTEEAVEVLRALDPRYDIERLVVKDVLDVLRERSH